MLIGVVGLIGHVVAPRASYWVQTYGPWGLVVSIAFDAVFIALGSFMLVRAGPKRQPGVGLIAKVDAYASRQGARTKWREYSPAKRRLWASLLTLENAVLSLGAGWLLTQADVPAAVAWWVAGAWFVWFTAFLWGLTIDPTKAARWGLLLGPPFFLLVGVGGGLLVWSVSGP